MFKKLTAGLLLAAMLASAACGEAAGDTPAQAGNAGDNGAVTEAAATEAAETFAIDTIEKQDFGGREFEAVSTNQDRRQVDIVAEEENGATLNALVYRRNSKLEELFNVKIIASDKDYSAITDAAVKAAQAGDNPYDLYMTNFTAYSAASKGYLLPWNTVSSMDITQPWWDQAAISDMSIAGNSYLITGDISPTCMLTSECILFNKKLFDNMGMEYQYQTAFDGKWTIDKMIDQSKGLTTGLDGDGVYKDKTDLFGFTLWFDGATALYYGQGAYMSRKEDGDIPVIDYNVDKISSRIGNIYTLLFDNDANYSKSDHELSFKVFNQGRAYFCDITFQKVEMFLRDMEDDYGVLPLPKYDETQDRYQTNVSGAGTAIIIPVSCAELDTVGTLIDAYAAIAYDDITPSLFDVIASVKNTRDEESAQMVQLIIRNRVFDPVRMYGIPGGSIAEELMQKKSNDVASYLAKNEPKAVTQLEKLIEAFADNT